MSSKLPDYSSSIAVIGMACRFPGAENHQEFWQNLRNGKEGISFFSEQELLAAGYDADFINQTNYVRAKGCCARADYFDADFFKISRRQAELLDPQHRILLQAIWHALEDAGYVNERTAGKIGVFVGSSTNQYYVKNLVNNLDLRNLVGEEQLYVNNANDFLANRASYLLNLTGPSNTIQTSCSTSLVAIAQACENLLDYQCDLAVAGGVSLSLPLISGYEYVAGSTASPDGHCRAFDINAQGTVLADGVGIVILKRAEQAIADKDHIYAIIKGYAVNNDGHQKVGFTAPSQQGQAEVIAAAYAMAEFNPEDISYIEAHGTGTNQGDPIEIAALTEVFREHTDLIQYCAVGSVKTNLGHLEAASGVSGLIKTCLALENKEIPPTLHFTTPNPLLNLESSPFYINAKLDSWQARNGYRRAGVSSFGFGGTNVHLALEEAPVPEFISSSRPSLIVLSAQTPQALVQLKACYLGWINNTVEIALPNLAYTTQLGRASFPYRFTTAVNDINELRTALVSDKNWHADKKAGITFIFPGQGTEYLNMAFDLYNTEPFFKNIIDDCAVKAAPHFDFMQIWRDDETRLHQTQFTQPILFIIEYALAALLRHWGIEPQAMIGHSLGEYTAACIAGVFNLEAALEIVITRGKLMSELEKGLMLAINAESKVIQPLLNLNCAIAAINSPMQCVVSGPVADIEQLEGVLKNQQIETRWLPSQHAFHSPSMELIWPAFEEKLQSICFNAPRIPFISNYTGTWIRDEEAVSPEYWKQHLRHTVQFSKGIQALLQHENIFIEVGPGRVLTRLIQQQSVDNAIFINLLAGDNKMFYQAIGDLWQLGVNIDWQQFNAGFNCARISLPTYPFQQQRYWIDPPLQQTTVTSPIYRENWTQNTLPAYVESTAQAVIFLNAVSPLEELMPDSYIKVYPSDHYHKFTATEYHIDPAQLEHYKKLVQALMVNSPSSLIFIYAWSFNSEQKTHVHLDDYKRYFFNLINLARAIGESSVTLPIKIKIVTSHLFRVFAESTSHPEKSLLMGPCLTIPTEYPNITCSLIDYPSEIIDPIQFLAELNAENSDRLVAYRKQKRWVLNYMPCLMPEKSTSLLSGTYVITGGLGGLGLLFARFLIRKYHAKVALLQRSIFPPRAKWTTILADSSQKALHPQIKQLQELESFAGEIMLVSGDVTDSDSITAAFAQVKNKWGKITGVIHAAGLPSGKMMQNKSEQEMLSVLEPKIKGTMLLHTIAEHEKIEYLILFSSLASVLSMPGQVDYCSANAFLNYFSNSKLSHFTSIISINWDMWKNIGMSRTLFADPHFALELEPSALDSDEGFKIFERILNNSVNPSFVCKSDLNARLNKPIISKHQILSESKPLDINKKNSIENRLLALWRSMLGNANLTSSDNFFDAGGDSLLAIQLCNNINKLFDTHFFPHDLLQANTVQLFYKKIQTQQPSRSKLASNIIKLKEGSTSPLFLIHPIGGTVYVYRDMVKALNQDWKIYGIQALGLVDPSSALNNIGEMARIYIESIEKLVGDAPYRLAGSSFGGIVAYEMAQQLSAKNKKIELLALIDSPFVNDIPLVLQTTEDIIEYLLASDCQVNIDKDVLLSLSEQEKFNFFINHYKKTGKLLPETDLSFYFNIIKNNARAMYDYTAAPYQAKNNIFYFRAQENDNVNRLNPENGWQALLGEQMQLFYVPGNHGTMLILPNVIQMANIINSSVI